MSSPSRERTAPTDGELLFSPLRWQAKPWLLALGVAALLPELTLWSAALLQALGLSQPYAAVQTLLPSADADLAVRRAVGWSLTLACPALAAMLSFLAYVDVEVHLGRGEVSGRLRPAASTSRVGRLLAAAAVLSGLLLFAMMIGHLILD